MRIHLAVLTTALAAVVGCATPVDEIHQASIRECPPWGCGSNSPVVDFRGFHDLNEKGVVNGQGYRITAFKKAGVRYTIDVKDGRLLGKLWGITALQGASLVGATIELAHTTGSKYVISVDAVGSTQMWASVGGVVGTLQTYLLRWKPVGASGQPGNVCSNPPGWNGESTLGMNATHAVLFDGDRIDAGAKVVSGPEADWFNIGCASHALAKLALTGFVSSSAVFGLTSTVDERTAMLKALTSDVCGTGRPFTLAGIALDWADARGSMHLSGPGTLEARWGPNGAICLDDPRITMSTNPAALADFPDVEGDIASECARPPSCWNLHGNSDPTRFEGSVVVTVNPTP